MNIVRQGWAALRLMLVFTVVLGLLYPLAGVVVAQAVTGKAQGQPGDRQRVGRGFSAHRATVRRRRVVPAAAVGGR